MNSIITSKTVANNERLAFLLRKMPRYYLQFENLVYDVADKMIKGYSGAYWEFVELSN
jgi:hypothetical protein